MNQVVLSIGSNDGDRTENVRSALAWLSSVLDDTEFSEIYETPDYTGCPCRYMNAVAIGETGLGFQDLNRQLKEYEIESGRTADKRASGLVPVDIDIVIWNGDIVRRRDFGQQFFLIGYEALAEHQNLLAR